MIDDGIGSPRCVGAVSCARLHGSSVVHELPDAQMTQDVDGEARSETRAESDRETERQRDTQKDRETKREREGERDRQSKRDRKNDTQRDKQNVDKMEQKNKGVTLKNSVGFWDFGVFINCGRTFMHF